MSFRLNILVILTCLMGVLGGKSFGGDFSETKITFKSVGGTTLEGTLVVPKGVPDTRYPALVLIAGSGPTDRDGNQPPALVTDLLKQIAAGLAKNGISSLRYDKRGMYANAAELPKDPKLYGDFFTWENFAADAQAAFRFLRDRPEIDPTRVGILGHSEGGLLALVAADALGSEANPPKVLILLSTPGRPIDAVITDQLTATLQHQGATPDQSAFFLDANARVIKAIRNTGSVPADVPQGLAALYPAYLGKFLRSELATDPCKLAADFSGPVLVIAGARDTQVSPEKDAKALDAALKTRKIDHHELTIIPSASHNLKLVANDQDPGFIGELVPEAMEKIGIWVGRNLGSR